MPVNRLCKIIIAVLCCCCVKDAAAQQKYITLSAGTGFSYVSKKKIDVDYSPAMGMNISASLVVPVSDKICFETGLGYRRKGFKGYSRLIDEDNRNYYHAHAFYDYLSIPLTVSCTVRKTNKSRLWIGGGMVYSFLLKARSDVRQEVYSARSGNFIDEYAYTVTPRIGLVQSKRREIGLFMFDTGLRLQAGYVYRDRYLLQLFHEHSLYSFVANAHDGSSLKLRYTGISVGVVIPKMKR